jgi:hypothetical protein
MTENEFVSEPSDLGDVFGPIDPPVAPEVCDVGDADCSPIDGSDEDLDRIFAEAKRKARADAIAECQRKADAVYEDLKSQAVNPHAPMGAKVVANALRAIR